MKIFSFIILFFLILTGCARKKDINELKTTRVTVKSFNDLKLFTATTDGPFRFEIEGADVTIKLMKEEPKLGKDAEKEKKQ